MLRKIAASEWLALCLVSYVLGDAAPWLTDIADFFIIITGKVTIILIHPLLFENLERLTILSETISKTEGICWLSHSYVCIT